MGRSEKRFLATAVSEALQGGELSEADCCKAVKSPCTTFLRKSTIKIHFILQASDVQLGSFWMDYWAETGFKGFLSIFGSHPYIFTYAL